MDSTIANIPVYEVQPTGTVKGGLIVLHEVWGLTDHIKDVASRFGREGYYVVAPNLLSETDIEAHVTRELQQDLFNPEKRNEAQPKIRQLMAPIQTPEFAKTTVSKLLTIFDQLYKNRLTHQKVGVIGYCFGGTYSYNLSVAETRLSAAVPYYGHNDHTAEELRQITCPILAFYGEKDQNLISQLPELEEKMHDASVDFTAQVYKDAGHAFFNDTNPYAYNRDAARDAWVQTLDFLDRSFSS